MCISIWFPVFTIIVQIVLEKGPFASVKGHLCLTKVHLDYHEGQVEVESPIIESCFWYFWFKSTKKVFFKKGLLNKASNSRMLYLSKTGDGITSQNIWRGWYYFTKYLKGMVLLRKIFKGDGITLQMEGYFSVLLFSILLYHTGL